MEKTEPILHDVAVIVSENMGQGAGEDFYSLYKFEDEKGILEGAKALLIGLLGPEMAEKKLASVRKTNV